MIARRAEGAELSASNQACKRSLSMQVQKIISFCESNFSSRVKKEGVVFSTANPPPPSPLSSDDAIEIELSDWLVNQDYVICKQTSDSIVTKSAPVDEDNWQYDIFVPPANKMFSCKQT